MSDSLKTLEVFKSKSVQLFLLSFFSQHFLCIFSPNNRKIQFPLKRSILLSPQRKYKREALPNLRLLRTEPAGNTSTFSSSILPKMPFLQHLPPCTPVLDQSPYHCIPNAHFKKSFQGTFSE